MIYFVGVCPFRLSSDWHAVLQESKSFSSSRYECECPVVHVKHIRYNLAYVRVNNIKYISHHCVLLHFLSVSLPGLVAVPHIFYRSF